MQRWWNMSGRDGSGAPIILFSTAEKRKQLNRNVKTINKVDSFFQLNNLATEIQHLKMDKVSTLLSSSSVFPTNTTPVASQLLQLPTVSAVFPSLSATHEQQGFAGGSCYSIFSGFKPTTYA